MNTSSSKQGWRKTRKSLLDRLRKTNSDHESWSEFIHLYKNLVFSVARKKGLSEQDAEDVSQETFKKVCKNIENFEYDHNKGKFRNWLCQLTKWQVANHYRRKNNQPLIAEPKDPEIPFEITQVHDELNGFDAIWEEEHMEYLTKVALGKLKQNANLKHCQLFELYVIRGKSPRKISETMGVSENEVHQAKSRLMPKFKSLIENIKN